MSWPKTNHYGVQENPILFNPYNQSDTGEFVPPPPPGDVFLLLDGSNFLLLDGSNFLLL